jgi:hypothetical protein
MKPSIGRAFLIVLAIALHAPAALRADTPDGNTSEWHIKDIYDYLASAGEDLSDEET